MKKIALMCAIGILISFQSESQTIQELTKMMQAESINSIEIVLSNYGYRYEGTKPMRIEGESYDVITFSIGEESVLIYRSKNKWINLQVVTYDQFKFNKLKLSMENLGGTLIDEKVSGATYTRMFQYQNFIYSYVITASQDYSDKKMYAISISDLTNFK